MFTRLCRWYHKYYNLPSNEIIGVGVTVTDTGGDQSLKLFVKTWLIKEYCFPAPYATLLVHHARINPISEYIQVLKWGRFGNIPDKDNNGLIIVRD